MIENHAHCHACHEPIPKYVKVNGKRKVNENAHVVGVLVPVMNGSQIQFTPRQVPICEACFIILNHEKPAVSKLIIPGMTPPMVN